MRKAAILFLGLFFTSITFCQAFWRDKERHIERHHLGRDKIKNFFEFDENGNRVLTKRKVKRYNNNFQLVSKTVQRRRFIYFRPCARTIKREVIYNSRREKVVTYLTVCGKERRIRHRTWRRPTPPPRPVAPRRTAVIYND